MGQSIYARLGWFKNDLCLPVSCFDTILAELLEIPRITVGSNPTLSAGLTCYVKNRPLAGGSKFVSCSPDQP